MRRWGEYTRRRYKVGRREIRGSKASVGQECCISRGGPDGSSSTVEVYMLEESEKKVTVLVGVGFPEEARTAAGRAAPGVRATQSFESRKRE